jgi:hypothetical protein
MRTGFEGGADETSRKSVSAAVAPSPSVARTVTLYRPTWRGTNRVRGQAAHAGVVVVPSGRSIRHS